MAILKRGVALAFFLVGATGLFPSSVVWRAFRSPDGFSLMYPSSWYRQNVSPDRLDILSSRAHWEAVVIAKGEGYISAGEEPESPRRTLAQVIQRYERGAKVLLRADIPESRRGECGQLEEVVSEEPPVPPGDVPTSIRPQLTDLVYTGLFCQIKGRIIVLILKSWQGDKRQEEYQGIALRMAKSVSLTR